MFRIIIHNRSKILRRVRRTCNAHECHPGVPRSRIDVTEFWKFVSVATPRGPSRFFLAPFTTPIVVGHIDRRICAFTFELKFESHASSAKLLGIHRIMTISCRVRPRTNRYTHSKNISQQRHYRKVRRQSIKNTLNIVHSRIEYTYRFVIVVFKITFNRADIS